MPERIRYLGLIAMAVSVLIAGPLLMFSADVVPDALTVTLLPDMPACRKADSWEAAWSPEFVGADQETLATYQCEDYRVHVFLAQYFTQAEGKEAVSVANQTIPIEWKFGRTQTSRQALKNFEVIEYIFQSEGRHFRIWTWYSVDDRATSNPFTAKMWEAVSMLRGARASTSIFIIATDSRFEEIPRQTMSVRAGFIWKWYLNMNATG